MESKETVISAVYQIVKESIGLDDDYSMTETFQDLGVKSISLMKIQADITKRFGVRLRFQVMNNNNTVEKMSNYIMEKLNG